MYSKKRLRDNAWPLMSYEVSSPRYEMTWAQFKLRRMEISDSMALSSGDLRYEYSVAAEVDFTANMSPSSRSMARETEAHAPDPRVD